MNNRIDWTELFFSSSGRTARGPFLIAAGILIVFNMIYESLVGGTPLHWVSGVVVYPLILFCSACVLSKRLHDRGKSGWWAGIVLFAVVMVWPHPEGVIDFIGLMVLGWATVELALMRGEQGANRYGAPPVRIAYG